MEPSSTRVVRIATCLAVLWLSWMPGDLLADPKPFSIPPEPQEESQAESPLDALSNQQSGRDPELSGDGQPVAELVAVPETPLDGLEPAVRSQLQEKRQALQALLDADAPHSDLIPAFGDLGQLYLLYDRPEAAAACFENVTRLVPGEPNAWYYLGVIHQGTGRFDSAVAAFEQVLESRPDDLATLLRGGEIRFQQRRLDEAAAYFDRAHALDPSSASVAFGRGRIANARRQWQEAVELFERTLELQPDADSVFHPLGLAHRRLGDIEAAKAALAKAGPNTPVFDDPLMSRLFELTATSRSFFIEGNRARRRGLAELAESYYRRALDLDPSDASVLYNLGTLLGEHGRVDEAEDLFRRAVEHKGDHRDARFNLAVSQRARGALQEAVQGFESVVQLDPTDSAAIMELGATLFAAGSTESGLSKLRQVADGPIQDPQMGLQLARYLLQTGMPERAPEVLDKADRAAVQPADRVEIRLLQSELAMAGGDSAAAATRLEQAMQTEPTDPRPPVRLAMLRCGQGRQDAAIAVLEAALTHQPEEVRVIDSLARLLATSPQPEDRSPQRALELAQALFDRSPGPQSAITLAMAKAANGDFAGAIALQERLVREVGPAAPLRIRQRLESNLERYRRAEIARPPC